MPALVPTATWRGLTGPPMGLPHEAGDVAEWRKRRSR
jgi:hypothetical protein